MRDQIAKLVNAQAHGEKIERVIGLRNGGCVATPVDFDAVAILAEFDRLSKIEAAAKNISKHLWIIYGSIPPEISPTRALLDKLLAALAPSTGKSEKPDG